MDKEEYPRLPICIEGDALYATEPFMKLCREYNWCYILTQKGSQAVDSLEKIENN